MKQVVIEMIRALSGNNEIAQAVMLVFLSALLLYSYKAYGPSLGLSKFGSRSEIPTDQNSGNEQVASNFAIGSDKNNLTASGMSVFLEEKRASAMASRMASVPIPKGVASDSYHEWQGIASLRYTTGISAARVGAFYLDHLDESWILIDSDTICVPVKGWSGSFISADFEKSLYIFALPRDLQPTDSANITNVSVLVIERQGDGSGGEVKSSS